MEALAGALLEAVQNGSLDPSLVEEPQAAYSEARPCSGLVRPSGPREEGASTSQGRPHSIFMLALHRRNVVAALAAAPGAPAAQLADALELTMLIACKDPRQHPRVAARWLLSYLEECEGATIDGAPMVAACLAALAGDRHRDAAMTLRANLAAAYPSG